MQANFDEFPVLFLQIFVKISRKVSDLTKKMYPYVNNLGKRNNRADLSPVSSLEKLVKDDWWQKRVIIEAYILNISLKRL